MAAFLTSPFANISTRKVHSKSLSHMKKPTCVLESPTRISVSKVHKFEQLRSLMIDALRQSFDEDVYPSAYRSFGRWALGTMHVHKETYLDVLGVNQLAKLTCKLLLPALPSNRVFDNIQNSISVYNTWMVHEILSDNLAAGLGLPQQLDSLDQRMRRYMLVEFNEQTACALLNCSADRNDLYRRFKHHNDKHSLFSHMQLSAQLEPLLSEFARSTTGNPNVDGCIAASLSANIVSAVRACSTLRSSSLKAMVARFAAARYTSCNKFLTSDILSTTQAIEHGTLTILVAPLLGHHCAVIAESLREEHMLASREVLPVLEKSLLDASQQVRLLNDFGSHLMLGSLERRGQALSNLKRHLDMSGNETIIESMARIADLSFSRIKKDAIYKETNICLHGIAHLPLTKHRKEEIISRIEICANLYLKSQERLKKSLRSLTILMENSTYEKLISSFVCFHEVMYTKTFDSEDGDYAKISA